MAENERAHARRTVAGDPVVHRAARVDLVAAILDALATDRIEGLEREADGIHQFVTSRAGRVGAMGLHLLAHRRWAVVAGGIAGPGLERRHDGRRIGGRHTDEELQHPVAANRRRRTSRLRGHREEGSLAQQAPAVALALIELDAAEFAALDSRNAVEPRQPVVDEGVVGGEQIEDAAVFLHQAGEQQLDFLTEGLAQVVIEVGKLIHDRLMP